MILALFGIGDWSWIDSMLEDILKTLETAIFLTDEIEGSP